MKKIFLSLAFAIFTIVNCAAQNSASIYKKSNIFSRNNAISIGMTVGMSETPCLFDSERPGGCSNPLLGANAKIYGVVFNMGTYLNHSSSVSLDYFENEDKGFYIHTGYNFQLLRWLSVAPLIGYSKHEIGDYDGSNWHLSYGGISNAFYSDDSFSGFDYGVQVSFDIPCGKGFYINIPMAMTKHVTYFGLGVTINMSEFYTF